MQAVIAAIQAIVHLTKRCIDMYIKLIFSSFLLVWIQRAQERAARGELEEALLAKFGINLAS